MKLLVVDSDRDLVEMLMGWLKTLGHAKKQGDGTVLIVGDRT